LRKAVANSRNVGLLILKLNYIAKRIIGQKRSIIGQALLKNGM
jgi:hypothetical protein